MELFPTLALVIIVFISQARTQVDRTNTDRINADPGGRPQTLPCASTRPTCQNFHLDIAGAVNAQIKEELNASYTYLAMGAWFARDDQALRGFSKFFYHSAEEEHEHAQKLIDYMNQRGGNIEFHHIPRPNTEWGSGLNCVQTALAMERAINDKLLDLHWLAQQRNDPHLTNFLEGDYLTEQVESIKQLADFSTILTRVASDPLGEHVFDQELYDGKR